MPFVRAVHGCQLIRPTVEHPPSSRSRYLRAAFGVCERAQCGARFRRQMMSRHANVRQASTGIISSFGELFILVR